MAVPPPTNEAFLREVDEEVRREQIINFWRRYGRWVAAAVVAGLVSLAALLGWQHYSAEKAGDLGERFNKVYDLLADGDGKKADKPLAELAKADIPIYRALAQTVQADVALRDADGPDPTKGAASLRAAAAKFAEIANDKTVAQPLRDLALIRQTYAEFDQLTPEQVVARMKPLAVKGSPWLGSAGELVVIAELERNQTEAARAMVQLISAEPNLPDSIRQRVVQLGSAIETRAATNAASAAKPVIAAPTTTNKEAKKQ